MDGWELYRSRIENIGGSKRAMAGMREERNILSKLPDSLSFTNVTILTGSNGYNVTKERLCNATLKQDVAIINSDNLNEKKILSLPGENIENGSLVRWMDNFWLVTEKDANTTLYTRAKLLQCNYLLKWVTDGKIYEQWCVIEDGTKYLTGEMEDRHFIVTRGDSRIAMTIARNEITKRFGRSNRFLIDDYDSPMMLAYQLTKPLKLGWTYNEKGTYKFVLQEVQTTDNDNQDLKIADYYKYFDKNGEPTDPLVLPDINDGREGWI